MPPANHGPTEAAPTEAPVKAKSKSKARKEADILPGNMAMNGQIRSLREHWQCSLTTCRSDYCFIPAEGPHFALGHEHLEKWAAAILHGPTYATLEKPPNIALFDPVLTHAIISNSAVLQARLDAIARERASPQQPPVPPINIILPNNYQLAPATLVPTVVPTTSGSLIPELHNEGPRIDMAMFCAIYCIPDDIHQRLHENKITGTHAFSQITVTDLKDMGLKLGEIINLKQVVKDWATPDSSCM